ncbi:uncharacterized protein LOC127352726 [Dicentrarchus labrax]|uniref:uncharacterized protein LOC127352726 n=1 Tax=Dicentrarchus labrax TaxID=13489 RepID=UPI0021F6456A|nr:uncharacterized protein LOC127352726 [Dicentrarchus labrax]
MPSRRRRTVLQGGRPKLWPESSGGPKTTARQPLPLPCLVAPVPAAEQHPPGLPRPPAPAFPSPVPQPARPPLVPPTVTSCLPLAEHPHLACLHLAGYWMSHQHLPSASEGPDCLPLPPNVNALYH